MWNEKWKKGKETLAPVGGVTVEADGQHPIARPTKSSRVVEFPRRRFRTTG
jgi:hypothetical protein